MLDQSCLFKGPVFLYLPRIGRGIHSFFTAIRLRYIPISGTLAHNPKGE
jgi:hypothetical protein